MSISAFFLLAMSKKRKAGRPPTGAIPRTHQVAFMLREPDAQWWADVAKDLHFVSRSQLFTAMAERIRVGGFAPITFLKLGMMLQKRGIETGAAEGGGYVNPFKSLPPLPLIDEPADEEILDALQQIEEGIKHHDNTNRNPSPIGGSNVWQGQGSSQNA
jgi:hypothetical protein